ncbi:histidine ammonia-lyase [Rhodohalobacter sp. SW132]|uniref:histidine ammonia-lyase n=1 Tax=Rhodohalobacter sp. SW132 TaxID=2293433 RepID=UPI000E26F0B7|nr:histidine ammonia-lyase [Rhodohalobacter sp. SW132]REL38816.1 histidine ammonia-lyase [Rhodohalobacter sp. SW132]
MYRISIAQLYKDIDTSLKFLRENSATVASSRKRVETAMADGSTYYGINTGFGALANQRISNEDLKQLQRNLILSHAVGTGELIPKEICRLMLQLKVHALGIGNSGISPDTFKQLLLFLEKDLIPAVPEKGSLGASGDLAPLAHMSLPLLGYGEFWNDEGTGTLPASRVLQEHNLEPIDLQAKDGLSLINGTQMMSAYGAYILEKSLRLQKMADLIGAMSLEALQGSITPFDKRIHELRPHTGQKIVAENVRNLLEDSEILESHRHCGKVQDPYCLRCIPQVHGASRNAIDHAISTVETEINSVTDNPLVLENGDILSGGNFHGQPLALVLDYSKIALAELASISERRTYLLLEGHDGLPKLLMEKTGINSGFMIPQYTSAALVSENKVLAHPSSVDSIPTSLGQEDHVSMGSISALHLYKILENVEQVLAIELFTAAQALDFRKPLRPGKGVETAHAYIRSAIPHATEDHFFKDEITVAADIVSGGDLLTEIENQSISLR